MKPLIGLGAGMLAASLCISASAPAKAAEGASGFYLLGSRESMAGFLPPPGTYVQDFNYYYAGSASKTLNFSGITVSGGIDANAFYNVPNAIWVAPGKVLGGNVAFNVMAPVGWKDITAGAQLSGPGGGVIATNIGDNDANFGDPVLGAVLGWHSGNWHWNVGTLVNVPIGYWEKGNLANIGFNRWAFDLNGAVTWLDMKSGLELSSAAGVTFNVENPDTDYKTGTEFHLEFSAMQNLSKRFAIGLNGYFYQQLTGDSGSGATLGSFKGRVVALGPAVNVNFNVGKIPVTANLRYFHEFDTKNRLEGDAGYVVLTMPLSVVGH